MAEEQGIHLPGRPIRRIRDALQGDRDRNRPPELRGAATRQLPAALGGLGMAAVLGPVGLLAGVAAGLINRREHRIVTEQWDDRERGIRQLNEGFQARAQQLEEQFAAGGTDMDAMNLAQLDEARRQHAQGWKLSQNADPELRAMGLQTMQQADAMLGGWLEDIETRNEGLINQELGTLRTELKEAQDVIRSTDDFITTAHDRFGRAMSAWNETSNAGQRRAIFNDFMGRMTEDFGDAAVMQGLVRVLGAGAGTLIGGAVGSVVPGAGTMIGAGIGSAAGGSSAGQLASALAKGDIQFSDDEMRRIMTATHQWTMENAQQRRAEHVRVFEGMTERVRGLNRYHTPPSTLEEYSRIPLPTPRDFSEPASEPRPPRGPTTGLTRSQTRRAERMRRITEETP